MKFLKEAIYHKPYGKWSFQVDHKTIEIVLRVRKNDIEIAHTFGGDVYTSQDAWKLYKMEIKYTDDMFDYYSVQVQPPYKRFKYYFKLVSKWGEYISYSEKELFVGSKKEFLSKTNNAAGSFVGETTFVFPYISPIDYQGAPEWVNKTIWYQIFPDRFAKGNNPLSSNKKIAEWDSIIGDSLSDTFMGGNINGIIEKLDYIKSIGFNGIYLCPIFKAVSNHKYDTEDYMQIDPDFGSEEDFINLIKEAHKKDIRIMIDGVFNHCGSTFAPWLDVLKNKGKSKYKNWFMINDMNNIEDPSWEDMISKNPYEAFAFVPSMPRLNWDNKETRNYILDVIKHWTKMGIDGWRMDVAYEPSHNFWQDVKRTMREINPESYLMGEIWTDSQAWMNGNEFDAVMNYINQDFIIKYICKQEISLDNFISGMTKASYMYPDSISKGNFNLLDSHDTKRIINFANGNKGFAKLAQFLLLYQTGSPSIYYGSEYLLEGGKDPDCRRCMQWNNDKKDLNHQSFIQKMIKLRKENIEWRKGNIKFIKINNKAFIVVKKHKKDISYAFLNQGKKFKIDIYKFIPTTSKIIYGEFNGELPQNDLIIFK